MLRHCISRARVSLCRIKKSCTHTIYLQMSTIYALSSGQGKCGVAVIRVSGSKSSVAVNSVANLKVMPQPRQAILRKFRDPVTQEVLDKGLLIWFPGPNSFSGEDSCEFQVHGGPAVVAAMLAALGKLHDYRPAEPGEFTRRAFHSGKLDLTEVEGLADLIHAETEAQRRQALLQAEGSLSQLYKQWRETLLKRHLLSGRCGERLREGVRTVIIGKPNAGKSSLLNVLCNRPAAIVSPTPGTTRDVVELHLSVGGYPMVLADTAGLRHDATDAVEREGISRTHHQLHNADLVLLVMDVDDYVQWEAKKRRSFREFLDEVVVDLTLTDSATHDGSLGHNRSGNYGTPSQQLGGDKQNTREGQIEQYDDSRRSNKIDQKPSLYDDKCFVILNKIDLLQNTNSVKSILAENSNVFAVSCKTEDGFPQLLDNLVQNLQKMCGTPSRETPTLSQARHRHHVTACAACLDTYLGLHRADAVLAAQQLRKAMRHVGSITGHVSTEQILDVIFRDFCIGK